MLNLYPIFTRSEKSYVGSLVIKQMQDDPMYGGRTINKWMLYANKDLLNDFRIRVTAVKNKVLKAIEEDSDFERELEQYAEEYQQNVDAALERWKDRNFKRAAYDALK